MTTTVVNLALVKEVVNDALKLVQKLDGTSIDDTTLGNRSSDARLNRSLLNLADQLLLASVLVRNEYWTGKGELSYDINA